ncbi:MAG: hypothetical protein ACK4RK_11930 [Gemmataceae bacterium]
MLRAYVFSLSLAGIVWLVVPAAAQERQRPLPFQPGQVNPANLLQNPEIARELKITDEQLKKYQELVQKALADSLTPDQLKRIKQIQLQQRGLQAFQDAEVQKELNLSEEQKTKISDAIDASTKATRDLFQERPANREDFAKKMQDIRKEATDKIQGALTDEQKKTWKDLVGEPFESRFARPGAIPFQPLRRPAAPDQPNRRPAQPDQPNRRPAQPDNK